RQNVAGGKILGAALLGHQPGEDHRGYRPSLLQNPVNVSHSRAVADHQQSDPFRKLGPAFEQLYERSRENLSAVPRTERADEADDKERPQAVTLPHRACINIRPITVRIDTVWIHENLHRADPAIDELLLKRAAHDDNQIRRSRIQPLYSSGQ